MSSKILDILTRYYPGSGHSFIPIPQIEEAFRKIVNCRTIELGGRLYTCPEHHAYSILYNSCRQRGCPVCNEMRRLQWQEKKLQILLPVEHNHLVFKLPTQLSILWLLNKKAVADILFESVSKTFESLRKSDGIMRGIINVLHTTGKNLAYHSHIHSLVTVEGMNADEEWKKQYLCSTKLEETYRNLVTKKLISGLSSGQLKSPTTQEEYISLVEKLAAREWRIFQSELYANGNGVIRYLAKHIKGMAVEERDIRRVTDEYIEVSSACNGKQAHTRLTAQEFVIRYLNHIPPKGLVMVRNLGLYSTRHIKETAELKKQLEKERGIAVVEKTVEAKKMKCPVCGKELELTNRFNNHELKRYIRQYLAVLGHSPPEHGKIYEKSKIGE